jgi:hypothetical protein
MELDRLPMSTDSTILMCDLVFLPPDDESTDVREDLIFD